VSQCLDFEVASELFPAVPDQLERRLRDRQDALSPAPRAELLHVLLLRDFDRVGEFWWNPSGEPAPHGKPVII
jgi:hypothetical protein